MPYIKFESRIYADMDGAADCGELNYTISLQCKDYLQDKGECYQTYNDIIGALEACKLEFYRRLVLPYEDKKIEQNGDIY